MKIEGVKDVQFTASCPLIEQSTRESWNWADSGGETARNRFYRKHNIHMGVNVLYKDGSKDSIDLGNRENEREAYSNLENWRRNIHIIHVAAGISLSPVALLGSSKILEGSTSNDFAQFITGVAELVLALALEGVTFIDWRARLRGPKLVAEKYSEALKKPGANILLKLGVV